jgi:formylglycine-generating enzyme required for sulfatase activity/predicted Ser/Thr protein kinase
VSTAAPGFGFTSVDCLSLSQYRRICRRTTRVTPGEMRQIRETTLAQPPGSPVDGERTELLDAPAATWQTPVAVDSILLGRFKLVRLIGEGGMSNVFKAVDLRKVEAGARDAHVAVKVLTFRFNDQFSSLAVMQQEATKLQALTHPNIVRVFDCDRDGQSCFMTMEYLDGTPLKRRMPKSRGGAPLPREEALRIVAGVAAALEFAHRNHIVHGDLKPGNVIVTQAGEVKVIDFGIARFLSRPQDQGEPTQEWERDFSAFTPPYASPEMHDGAEPDPRDDIYALASIAYELLTGEHPFGRAAANQAREAGMEVPKSKHLRAHEYRALEHALRFDRAQRTPGAQQFLEELSGTRQRSMRKVALFAGLGVLALAAALFAGRMLKNTSPVVIAPTAPLTEGTMFRDCPTCPLMRVLAPATFQQGSAGPEALSFEQPVHAVTIAYPLAAAVHEVTVGEFAEFSQEYPRARDGCASYDGEWRTREDLSWRNAVPQQEASFPATCVSWQDAADYAAWLSLRTGHTYRLPSASEWEYLAGAGSADVPWTNPADSCASANVADASAAQRFPGWTAFDCDDQYVHAAPVGSFAPNLFGLTDTLGNAFEWVQDCWRDDYTDAPTDGSAVLAGDCAEREARGGSWFTTPAFVRPGYRNRFEAAYRSNSVGFRLVREISGT